MLHSGWIHAHGRRTRFRVGATLIMLALSSSIVEAGPLPARVPGLMRLIPATRHPILFFGEYHGSIQSPAFFGDAVAEVCAFRPVLVILEQNQSEARLVSRYVNGKISMRDIVNSGEWLWALKAPRQREDGRHSIAMVKLLYQLRQLKEHGRVIDFGGTNADKLPPEVTYNLLSAHLGRHFPAIISTDRGWLDVALLRRVQFDQA